MVWSHRRIKLLSSHHWGWRKFLLLYPTLVPRGPLLHGKKTGVDVRPDAALSTQMLCHTHADSSPFWVACCVEETGETQVDTGQAEGNAS